MLGVWDGKLQYLPIQLSIRTVLNEIQKKCPTLITQKSSINNGNRTDFIPVVVIAIK